MYILLKILNLLASKKYSEILIHFFLNQLNQSGHSIKGEVAVLMYPSAEIANLKGKMSAQEQTNIIEVVAPMSRKLNLRPR